MKAEFSNADRPHGAGAIAEAPAAMFASAPDMGILAHVQIEPPKVPPGFLTEATDALCSKVAALKSVPRSYAVLSLLGMASMTIGATRVVSLNGWQECLALRVLLLGESSATKSPGMAPFAKAASIVEKDENIEFKKRMQEWEQACVIAEEHKKAWQASVKQAVGDGQPEPACPAKAIPPPKPTRARIFTNDATGPKLISLLCENPRGVGIVRDELAGLLMSLDRLQDGFGQLLLEGTNGSRYVYDVLKNGDQQREVPFLYIPIIGTLQPDRLASLLLKTDNDGQLARFLIAWPTAVRPQLADDSVIDDVVPELVRAFKKLRALDFHYDQNGEPSPQHIRLSTDALTTFKTWVGAFHDAHQKGAMGHLGSALGKMRGQALRIAGILTLLDWAFDPEPGSAPSEISAEVMDAAIEFIQQFATPMARRAIGGAETSKPDTAATALAREIMTRKASVINARDVRRRWALQGLRAEAEVKAAIDLLVDAHWLVAAPSRAGGNKGRTRSDWIVNPAVHRSPS